MQQAEKQVFVDGMVSHLETASGLLFVDYTKLTVAEANEFRSRLRAVAFVYQVVKNTLMTRALQKTPFAAAAACLQGTPTGVVIANRDVGSAAKITLAFSKECEHLKVKGGIVEKRALNAEQVAAIAELPSKEVLQGEVMSLALSPGRHLMGVIKGPMGRLLGAIDAKAEVGS